MTGREEATNPQAMRVLQVSAHHWLFSMGGSELYLRDLITVLGERGLDVPVLTFQAQDRSRGGAESDSPATLPLIEDVGVEAFRKGVSAFLDGCRPTLAHFHSLHAEEAVVAEELRRRGVPYFFTYHQPGATCRLGTLLRWGRVPCDGKVEVPRCAACRVNNRTGLPEVPAAVTATLIRAVSPLLQRASRLRVAAKVDYWGSTTVFARRLDAFLRHCEKVVACSRWGADVLRRNGVAANRIALIPQGLPLAFEAVRRRDPGGPRSTTNVGYVGRISPEKGLEVLVRAMRLARSPEIRLLIAGEDPEPGRPLESRLRALCAGDERVHFLGRRPPEELGEVYSDLDFLAVPATWFESGPLVVWEALSHGVPILASARIGHPELLEDGRGLIVEPHTPERWAEVLTRAAEGGLRLSVGPTLALRSMRAAALESADSTTRRPSPAGSRPARAMAARPRLDRGLSVPCGRDSLLPTDAPRRGSRGSPCAVYAGG